MSVHVVNQLFLLAYLAVDAVIVWALVALSAAGRTVAWYGMLAMALLYMLPHLLVVAFYFSASTVRPVWEWLDALSSLSAPGFVIAFAFYTVRILATARRARELEAECAFHSAQLGRPPAPGLPARRSR